MSVTPSVFVEAPIWAVRKARHKLSRMRDSSRHVPLRTTGKRRGNVLLSYIFTEFRADVSEEHLQHTNVWEVREMARILLDEGYDVDLIDFCNQNFKPSIEYTIFIDSRHNLQRLGGEMSKDCVLIHHSDTSHILSQDLAELSRLHDLQQRRGVTLAPRRYELPNLAIEHAHCATVIGNHTTLETFRYARKPLYPLPVPTAVKYDWNPDKDFDRARTHFLWFGSGGLVRKGLDLALEAFSRAPHLHLHICGPITKEADFVKVYERELFHSPNIHLHGWVEVTSDKFRDILDRCVAVVFPSCSEGQAGSVATAMQAGLIPIVSAATGIDADDCGVILEPCGIAEIELVIRAVAQLPTDILKQQARLSWELARETYTRENYTRTYRAAIQDIMQRFLGETVADAA
ncbi:MAG: glycosyltransferase [Caulobacteraceae bacterium]